jgi:RNA polymerase sigma-70 factor (sigma-E family)
VTTFSEFVQARGGMLWHTAWLLTGDRATAEDLLQTALVKAWPHYDRVSRDGSFEAYVTRALATTYAGWRRRRWWGETPTEDVGAAHRPAVAPDDAERTHDVRRALASLSPQQRAVVVLRYYSDLTEAETARALGCSVGSVKTHHARALARLRDSDLLDHPRHPDRTIEERR